MLAAAILAACAACVFVCGMVAMRLVERRSARERKLPVETPEPVEETPKDSETEEALDRILEEQPDTPAAPDAPARRTTLDLAALSRVLFASDDPVSYLRDWVGEARGRVEEAKEPHVGALELFLARSLEEAGIADELLDQAGVSVVRPSTSGLFYLRANVRELPYAALCRVVAVEAALNGALLASGLVEQDDELALEEVYLALQRLDARVCAQASRTPEPASARMTDLFEALAPDGAGEWSARCAISRDIECLRLPYRLKAGFRLNRAAGEAAVEFDYTPPEALRASCVVEGAGVVRRSREMLEREAGAYALRVAMLLARRVFADCPEVRRVWVADSHDTPAAHVCHLSAVFERDVLLALDLDRDFDPYRLSLALGVTMDADDGVLAPVRQGFSLDDDRFCPPARFEAPELSAKALPPDEASALGTKYVWGLGAFEDARRRRAADDIVRLMGAAGDADATLAGVRAVMAAAADDGSEGARESAERCARKLVDGRLAPDAWEVAEEYCSSGLGESVERAASLIEEGRGGEAAAAVEGEMLRLDLDGAFADEDDVAWRSFGGYAERVAYNRLVARRGVETRLVPEDYLEALVTLCAAHLVASDAELARRYAERACDVAPTSTRVRLYLVRCLEELGRADEAMEQVNLLLERAHDVEGLGWGYLHAARLLWERGDGTAAQAAYQRAVNFMPSLAGMAVTELGALVLLASGGAGLRRMSEAEVARELGRAGVTLAPTPEVTLMMMEAARAATDSGVFAVARELTLNLGAVLHDDVIFGILRSLDGTPDR